MGKSLKTGQKVTITGFDAGKRGQLVIDGRSVQSNDKCEAVGMKVFVIVGVLTSDGKVKAT